MKISKCPMDICKSKNIELVFKDNKRSAYQCKDCDTSWSVPNDKKK